MDKRMFQKTGEELQQYLAFKRKHFFVPAKKGKGSFKRKEKHSKISRMQCNGSTLSLGLRSVVQIEHFRPPVLLENGVKPMNVFERIEKEDNPPKR